MSATRERQSTSKGAARWLLAALLVTAPASARAEPVPVKFQAVLFKKIFSYDKALKDSSAKIQIVFSKESADAASEAARAFTDAGLTTSQVKADQLPKTADASTVFYILGSIVPGGLKELAAKSGALTVSGLTSLAESGEVSIGLGTKADGRPEIVVNLARLKVEGHELRAELLGLARVVGR